MTCYPRSRHEWTTADIDENGDRIRAIQECRRMSPFGMCAAWRMVTFAKRLDDQGNAAWGPPGEWTESEVEYVDG